MKLGSAKLKVNKFSRGSCLESNDADGSGHIRDSEVKLAVHVQNMYEMLGLLITFKRSSMRNHMVPFHEQEFLPRHEAFS